MRCPHCGRTIPAGYVADEVRAALERSTPPEPSSDRDELLAWLTHWRAEHSMPPANLRARSTAQLRSMKAEATRGAGYRVGRKWAKHG